MGKDAHISPAFATFVRFMNSRPDLPDTFELFQLWLIHMREFNAINRVQLMEANLLDADGADMIEAVDRELERMDEAAATIRVLLGWPELS